MNFIVGTRQSRTQALVSALQRASLVSAFVLFVALPSFSYSWYSGASVGSDGTVYGWGVTDITTTQMYHVAYATTSITSPKGRFANTETYAQNSTRADVSLPFSASDVGTYTVQTSNVGWCNACCCDIVNCYTYASANDAPARLVPANYGSCAPNGVGPLQVLNDQPVVDCGNNTHETNWDGVNRNLMYQLLDGTGTPFVGAYTLTESFSNFQKTPTNSGLPAPTARQANVAAYGLAGDYQYTGYKYPTYIGSNENISYTQSFTVTVSGTVYPLTTIVSMSLGNFNGTPEDNVTITTP